GVIYAPNAVVSVRGEDTCGFGFSQFGGRIFANGVDIPFISHAYLDPSLGKMESWSHLIPTDSHTAPPIAYAVFGADGVQFRDSATLQTLRPARFDVGADWKE